MTNPKSKPGLFHGHGEAEVEDYQPKINECNARWMYPLRPQRCTMQPGAVERELSSDEVEAQMSVDGSLQENLFSDNQAQDPQPDRDAMDARVEVQELSMDDSNICDQSQQGGPQTLSTWAGVAL